MMKKIMKEDKKAKGVAKNVIKMGKMMEKHEASEIKSMRKKGSKSMKKGAC
jgi:hypothetical protein